MQPSRKPGSFTCRSRTTVRRETEQTAGAGIGLADVIQRLRLIYGKEAVQLLTSRVPGPVDAQQAGRNGSGKAFVYLPALTATDSRTLALRRFAEDHFAGSVHLAAQTMRTLLEAHR